MDIFVKLDDVINLLIECGDLKGREKIEFIKPTHGNCCTCQTCGHYHDECVCVHNAILEDLDKLEKFKNGEKMCQ